MTVPVDAAVERRRGDLGAGRDRLAGDLADDLGDVGEGARQLIAVEVDDLGRHLVGRDPRRQRDVGRRDDDRARGRRPRSSAVGRRAPRRAAGSRRRRRSPGRPRRAGRADSSASSWFSPTRWCDRWHHSSTAPRAARLYQRARTIRRKRQEILHAARKTARFGVGGRRRPRRRRVVRGQRERPAGLDGPTGRSTSRVARSLRRDRIERAADDAQLVADLAAEEEQGDDGDDGDESKDECVFREALAVFVDDGTDR